MNAIDRLRDILDATQDEAKFYHHVGFPSSQATVLALAIVELADRLDRLEDIEFDGGDQ